MKRKGIHQKCLVVNVVILILLALSVIFPVNGSAVSDFNVETKDVDNMLTVTNNQEIEMKYAARGQNIKELVLYFNVAYSGKSGEADNGRIVYTLKDEAGEVLYEDSVTVDRIIHEKAVGMLSGTKVPVESEQEPGQVVQITVKGEGIPDSTKVYLQGNNNRKSNLVVVRYGVKYSKFPLFQVEAESKERPWTWDLMVLFFLSLVLTILTKERACCSKRER